MTTTRKKRKLKIAGVVVLVLGISVGVFAWYKFFREVPQPPFESAADRFMYGSIGSEDERGIPYWIWVVLPRIFPDHMPGPGGYASFGVVWEEGHEMPSGFAKKTVGFPRVTNNCAICHTATYRTEHDQTPTVVAAGPGHTHNLQAYARFLTAAAKDTRFNADRILREIELIYDLSWVDEQLYRFLIIPLTRKALLEQEDQFAWMNAHFRPNWGPGRDDPMNLTKFFMTDMDSTQDRTVGAADFPSIWNLELRQGQSMNWSGETLSSRAVIIDSALGLGMPAEDEWVRKMEELDAWLRALPPPEFPGAVDEQLAVTGREVFDRACRSCHGTGGEYFGKVIDIAEIGTDPERLETWSQEAADQANQAVADLGITRKDMVDTNGYVAQPLDGLWLRAPFLHNGSVPNLAELLEPVARRSVTFHRGYDLLDMDDLGFVATGEEAARAGFLFDTRLRGNGNGGHEYGTDLSPPEKKALIEYLKTE